tara:strand:- start:150 stop:713 length:564 start_codon:yes stop_codon:yes gene_type:complete
MRNLPFTITILLALFLSIGTAQSLSGQAPVRDGFFVGFGVGGGSIGFEGDSEREVGGAAYFKIGGALNDKVLIGAEAGGWSKEMEEEGVSGTVTSSNLNAVVYVYPDPTRGFFLKGGLGFALLEAEATFGDWSFSESENGFGFTLGAGYDIGFGGRFSLTPHADFDYGGFEDSSINLIRFGLGFNWY